MRAYQKKKKLFYFNQEKSNRRQVYAASPVYAGNKYEKIKFNR
jgi:hypothetical protein